MTVASDVIVVGLGAMGSAVLHRLAADGVRAVGIDRFHPPHDRGSSHGETRGTRLAVGEGDVYVPMVQRSHELWRALEARTGERLLETCGFLAIDTSDGSGALHGLSGFFDRTIDIARRFGIAHERVDGAELRRRYPMFRVPDDARGYQEPGGGLVYPERCIAAQLTAARADGATIVTGETVLTIEPDGSGLSVLTDRGRYRAARAVLAAGAWTPGLAGPALGRMRVLRQVLHWFDPDDPDVYRNAARPVFLWLHGPGAEDSFYGFPPQGDGSVKLATEQYRVETPDPDLVDRIVPAAEAVTFVRRHANGRLAGLSRAPSRSQACLYTQAPDAGFAIDWSDAKDRVLVVSACSGHGFKHAPAVGEHVAALVQGRAKPRPEFRLDRAALRGASR